MKDFLFLAFAATGLLLLSARVEQMADQVDAVRVVYLPHSISPMVEDNVIEAMPFIPGSDDSEITEKGRFFGRRPDPKDPSQPQLPVDPPPFEFPGEDIDSEDNNDDSSSPARGTKEVGFQDWEPEDWAAFFEKLISFITAISGLFAGVKARRAGGIGKLLKQAL